MAGLFASQLKAQFQQRVDHVIEVSLDDSAHVLHGFETITYQNNSPDPLDTIWLHLWPNAYRDRSSALCEQLVRGGDLSLHYARPEQRGWIDSLAFRSN
ncbi:MAG: hypothetical protein KDB88_08110, partial [Flavobacteriales bacterium]|nr:hypothetical protein [Flavobacteriales bacterium]